MSGVVRIWHSFDRSCTRFDQWWAKLRYWQKGAIIGGGLHLIAILLIGLAFFFIVPLTPAGGDMGPPLAWFLAALFGLVELLPNGILYLFPGLKGLGAPGWIWFWVYYIIYATLIYTVVGIVIAKTIEFFRKLDKGTQDDKHGK